MTELLELLFRFWQIGLFSIGGGYATLPLIEQQMVTESGWLTLREFTDIVTISQMTPGPLAVNASTFVGLQVAGLPGAVVATLGCVISGIVLSLGIYRIFQRFQRSAGMAAVMEGLRAVSAGLIASAAATLLVAALWTAGESLPVNIRGLGILIAAFLGLRLGKWNPMTVLLLSGLAGLVVYSF